jgi:hypothetical protein
MAVHKINSNQTNTNSNNNQTNNVDHNKSVVVVHTVHKQTKIMAVNVEVATLKVSMEESRIQFTLMVTVNLVNIHGRRPF